MSLVEYYLNCTFDLANANKFHFHGQTLGLSPNKTVQVIMTLYDPSTCYEVEDHIDIQPSADINTQLLCTLLGQMERLQPGTTHRQFVPLLTTLLCLFIDISSIASFLRICNFSIPVMSRTPGCVVNIFWIIVLLYICDMLHCLITSVF